MGLTRVTVTLKATGGRRKYEAAFLVDTGATDTFAPGVELRRIGVKPVGKMAYELANGAREEYEFGLAEISFMGEVTAGRVIFGPNNTEPLLGVTALESVGIVIDPANQTLKRLPAIPLKQISLRLNPAGRSIGQPEGEQFAVVALTANSHDDVLPAVDGVTHRS